MKISDLKPNMIVYDCHSYKMGNTNMKTLGIWPVKIIEVHKDHAIVSWNGNYSTKYDIKRIKALKKEKPYLVHTITGRCRRETREERKTRLAKQDSTAE